MKENFYYEFQALMSHSQEIVDKYGIEMSYQGGYMPEDYHKDWVLFCKEDSLKIKAMIELLDELEKENKELKIELEKLRKQSNPIDYYYPCGGGTLF